MKQLKKLKAWYDRNDAPVVTMCIFGLIVLIGLDVPWVSPICMGLAWFLVNWLYSELAGYRRLARREYQKRHMIEGALKNSNMQMVAYCSICTQKVLDIDEHYKKIHPDSDYAKEIK